MDSAEDRWTSIRRSVLEDTTLTLAEFRALLYLAAKPPGWVVHQSEVAKSLGWKLDRARLALRGLRAKDYIEVRAARDEHGTFTRHESRLCREKVIQPAKPQAGTTARVSPLVEKSPTGADLQECESSQVGSTARVSPLVVPSTGWKNHPLSDEGLSSDEGLASSETVKKKNARVNGSNGQPACGSKPPTPHSPSPPVLAGFDAVLAEDRRHRPDDPYG